MNIPKRKKANTAYENIGFVYEKMGDQFEALLYFEKSFSIRQNVLSSNHLNLIDCYNHIGLIFCDMSQNVKAPQIAEKNSSSKLISFG